MLRIFAVVCAGVLIGFGSMAYAYHGSGQGGSGAWGPRADCPYRETCPRLDQSTDTPATQPGQDDGARRGGGGHGHRHRHGGCGGR
jgi:hypothetical protein